MGEVNKNTVVSGVFWKLSERILAEAVALIVSIFLARILSLDDYSVVALVLIFISIANVLVSSGLNTALIQKKNAEYIDYCSVLFVSVIISIVLYVVLFFLSSEIANIFNKPILSPIIKVMGLVLIVNSVKSVLCAYISNKMEFKLFFLSTLVGTVISGVIGIGMALSGFGPWALVAQYVLNALIDTLVLFLATRFRISFCFSLDRFKTLWKYGWKIFVSELISVSYDNISPLVIGIRFSSSDLASYTKGRQFPNLLNSTLTSTLSAVLFPALSKMQGDVKILLAYTRKFVTTASYCIAPIMLGFFAVSDNFVIVLLTEKWIQASIYIKVFCLSCLFSIMTTANLQTIKAIGKSNVYLILEIIKKTAYLIVLVLFVVFSPTPEIMSLSAIVISILAMIINGYPNQQLIGYKFSHQVLDLVPNIFLSLLMAIPVYLMNYISINVFLLLIFQIFVGFVIYFVLSILFKPKGYLTIMNMLKHFLMRWKIKREVI